MVRQQVVDRAVLPHGHPPAARVVVLGDGGTDMGDGVGCGRVNPLVAHAVLAPHPEVVNVVHLGPAPTCPLVGQKRRVGLRPYTPCGLRLNQILFLEVLVLQSL
jgi:hypothetical protein